MYAGFIASVIGHVLLIVLLAVGLPELFPPEDKVITANSIGVITEDQLAALTEPNLPPAREASASAAATDAAASAAQEASSLQAAESAQSANAQDAAQAGANTAALTAAAVASSAAAQTADATTAASTTARNARQSPAREAATRNAAVRPLTSAKLATNTPPPPEAVAHAPRLPPRRPVASAVEASEPVTASAAQPQTEATTRAPRELAAVTPTPEATSAAAPETTQTSTALHLPPRRPPPEALTSKTPDAATAKPPEIATARVPELAAAKPREAIASAPPAPSPATPPNSPDEPRPREVLTQSAVTRAEARKTRLPPRRPAHLDEPPDAAPNTSTRQIAVAPQKAAGKKPAKQDFFASMKSSIGAKPTAGGLDGVRQTLGVGIAGARVSKSDQAALAKRLGECWLKPNGQRNARELIVELAVELDTSSDLIGTPRVVKKPPASAGAPGRVAVERAMQAVQACAPLNAKGLILPPNSYSNWRTMRITFDPS